MINHAFSKYKKYENKNADTVHTVHYTLATQFLFARKQTKRLYGVVISRGRCGRLLCDAAVAIRPSTRAKITRTDNDKNSKTRRGTRCDEQYTTLNINIIYWFWRKTCDMNHCDPEILGFSHTFRTVASSISYSASAQNSDTHTYIYYTVAGPPTSVY